MRKLLPFVVLATLIITCKKNEDNPNEVTSTDKNFLVQTYQAARTGSNAGEQALTTSNSVVVQNFSQRIIADYNAMRSDIKAVANKINFVLADTAAQTIQAASPANNLSGYALDTTYMGSAARNLFNLLTIFYNESIKGNNTYVRYYFRNKYVDRITAYYFEADSILRKL